MIGTFNKGAGREVQKDDKLLQMTAKSFKKQIEISREKSVEQLGNEHRSEPSHRKKKTHSLSFSLLPQEIYITCFSISSKLQ